MSEEKFYYIDNKLRIIGLIATLCLVWVGVDFLDVSSNEQIFILLNFLFVFVIIFLYLKVSDRFFRKVCYIKGKNDEVLFCINNKQHIIYIETIEEVSIYFMERLSLKFIYFTIKDKNNNIKLYTTLLKKNQNYDEHVLSKLFHYIYEKNKELEYSSVFNDKLLLLERRKDCNEKNRNFQQ